MPRFYIEDYVVDAIFKLHNKENKWINIVEFHCNDFDKSYEVDDEVSNSLLNDHKDHPLVKEFLKELKSR